MALRKAWHVLKIENVATPLQIAPFGKTKKTKPVFLIKILTETYFGCQCAFVKLLIRSSKRYLCFITPK